MIYNWLIKHKKSAYGIAIGFLIFTILVYAFQSHWFVRHIYKYINYWAVPLSAAFMLVLAYMAYISITENRRIRAEDRKLYSMRRALHAVRNWVQESERLMLLNAKYSDEYQRKDSPSMKKTLEDIQSTKMDLVTMGEEVLRSARVLGPELFSLVDKAYQNLTRFVDQGMAEKTDIDDKYRYTFLLGLTNVKTVARDIESKDLNLAGD